MHRYKDKMNNIMVKSKTNFFTVATFVLMAGTLGSPIIAPLALQPASAQAFIDSESNLAVEPKAPIEVSPNGRNAYIVWWTNSSQVIGK